MMNKDVYIVSVDWEYGPWNLCLKSVLDVTHGLENGTIRKLGYFLFALQLSVLAVSTHALTRRTDTPTHPAHDGIGSACTVLRGKIRRLLCT